MKQFLALLILLPAFTSVYYSVNPDFTISYQHSHDQLAHAVYQDKNFAQGWNYLWVYGNPEKDLLEQRRGAGFVEGYATYKEIYYAYKNFYEFFLQGEANIAANIQNFLDSQLDYMNEMIEAKPRDIFWIYANAYLQQLRYMYRGYLTRLHEQKRLDYYMGFSQFYYLTNIGDLEDLIHKTNGIPKQQHGNCNGYAKFLNNTIYVAHSTHNAYSFLLRVFKTYSFPSRDSRVGSDMITFSSRPGDLTSKDDFYVLSSGLKVIETSFNNHIATNYDEIVSRSVPCWLRSCIATNLARDGQEFVDYFLRERSGTHNNQWVVIDTSKLSSRKNVIQFVQEAFSIYKVLDMSDLFFQQGYIGSYNVPYSVEIRQKLGYNGDYTNDARAEEFREKNPAMVNEQNMKFLLLNNSHEDPRVGLAPRYDLVEGGYAFGLTDCKIVTPNTEKDNFVWAISGPSTSSGRFPPFDWDKWSSVPHGDMYHLWNYTWVRVSIDIEKVVPEQQLLQQ